MQHLQAWGIWLSVILTDATKGQNGAKKHCRAWYYKQNDPHKDAGWLEYGS